MKKTRYISPILLLALIPSTASANAGTPLMWASMLHLVFGNAIIGLIEGLLLAWIFKCSKWKSILILIAANYASAWAGGFFISGYLASIPDITIQTIQFWFLVFVLAAFIVTLLIEFPFFWLALRSHEHPLRQAFVATPIIHGVSYALLFGWYWMAIDNDYVVAQLGDDQVCMIHPASKRIALIARGRGPIVAKPKQSNKIEEHADGK